jgi:hypothetical protein
LDFGFPAELLAAYCTSEIFQRLVRSSKVSLAG